MDDLQAAIDRAATSKDCEAIIWHIGARVAELRALQAKAHELLEGFLVIERQEEMRRRPADFPPAQGIGL